MNILRPLYHIPRPASCKQLCRVDEFSVIWNQVGCAGQSALRSQRLQVIATAVKQRQKKMNFFVEDETEEDKGMEAIADMEAWMENRPLGFGQGKVYDLSLEEKLMTEIEADRKAREADKKGLVKGPKIKAYGRKSGKQEKLTKVLEAPAGVEVWLGNLPRKRNVERDLRAVFRTVTGLLHIRPIVEADNEKTREPLCKGFAFLTFSTDNDAEDFVSRYHGVTLTFGKVDKKLACEVAVSDSPWRSKPSNSLSPTTSTGVTKLRVRDLSALTTSTVIATPIKSLGMGRESGEPILESVDTRRNEDVAEYSDDKVGEEVENETQLRALEEEIWQNFEDEDDEALDLELKEESCPEEESGHLRSRLAVDEQEKEVCVEVKVDSPAKPEQMKDLNLTPAGTHVGVVEPKTRNSKVLAKAAKDDAGEDQIKELEAKVREMEAKLQQVAQVKEERLALLERRVLGKAKAAVGAAAAGKVKKGMESTGGKKGNKAGTKLKAANHGTGGLGSAHRLKSKERKIFTEVMSKGGKTPFVMLDTCNVLSHSSRGGFMNHGGFFHQIWRIR